MTLRFERGPPCFCERFLAVERRANEVKVRTDSVLREKSEAGNLPSSVTLSNEASPRKIVVNLPRF